MAVVVNTRSPSDSRYTLKLNINPRSPDITNNRTTVDWSLVLSFSDSLSYGRYNYDPNPYSVVINGSTVSSGNYTYDFRQSSTKTIASGSTTIPHNSDGSKTISASCSASMLKPNYTTETISGSGSLTLPTIPRASQPRLSASSVTYGSAVTIYTDRKSSAFTHRIRANWNGTTETIANSVGVSYAWTVPLSYLNRIPNAKSTTGTIYLDTYNGSTLIGTKTVRLTTNAPSNIGPIIGSVNLTEAVSGLASQFGAFVQSKSRIKVTGSATGQYSASIKSYQIQINDETSGSSTYTSGYLKYSGTRQAIFRATDSRGFTSSKTVSYTALAYTPPRILAFNAFRSNASGMADPQGTYALAQYKANITSLNSKNTKAYKVRYRPVDTTTWTDITLNNDSYTPNSSRVLPNLDEGKSYEIQFVASDYFGSSSFTVKVSTIAVTMDFRPGGLGIGIGKKAEKDNALDLAWDYYSDRNPLDLQTQIDRLKQNVETVQVINLPITSLVTKWDPNFTGPQAIRQANGIVHLRGVLKLTGSFTNGDVIAILPEGFRPPIRDIFPAGMPGQVGRLDIESSGKIHLFVASPGDLNWFYISGVSFSTV